jgi:hypothetical protein
MDYKSLYVFVEGTTDERFFERIIKPKFEEKYEYIYIYRYAESKNEKTEKFIESIESRNKSAKDVDYIFVSDIDQAPCVTRKKQELLNKFPKLNKDKIVIVIKEIESWYLAGLDTKACKKLKIKPFNYTNDIDKEEFNKYIPKKFRSIDFMINILDYFSIETAKQKNNSFKYFANKYSL